ncbi:copper chaperone PCu(A)C [Aromatoleum diolicum]|uniref:Copper chaperone PCu(A)C n=1 Tax=Aromatoleum diolicum TaxID=75796 RepID=A0ABX1QBY0_9RHOO|nr:copper chaperone PCu(A)C [Aromatoleum diolicum]NMG75540.1 copper chaperone PCu(A)C [Aromatoleum diolicum]
MKKILAAVLLSFAVSIPALAEVKIEEPWVRATVAQQKATGAFMRITAPQDARLVSAKSPVAGKVEIHEMVLENDVMKMRPVAAVELPAGKPVELKPGGHHVMLLELKRPLSPGDDVPISLVVEGSDGKRETLELAAPVRPLHSTSGGNHGR